MPIIITYSEQVFPSLHFKEAELCNIGYCNYRENQGYSIIPTCQRMYDKEGTGITIKKIRSTL
jgi:hypothetical protein